MSNYSISNLSIYLYHKFQQEYLRLPSVKEIKLLFPREEWNLFLDMTGSIDFVHTYKVTDEYGVEWIGTADELEEELEHGFYKDSNLWKIINKQNGKTRKYPKIEYYDLDNLTVLKWTHEYKAKEGII